MGRALKALSPSYRQKNCPTLELFQAAARGVKLALSIRALVAFFVTGKHSISSQDGAKPFDKDMT